MISLLKKVKKKLIKILNVIILNAFSRKISLDDRKIGFTPISREKGLRVVQYIWTLAPGGSQRQLCNLSIELKKRHIDVIVLTSIPPTGEAAHFKYLLDNNNIPVHVARIYEKEKGVPEPKNIFCLPFRGLQHYITALVNELNIIKPDVLHCWLDHSNIIGCAAGIMTKAPKIILSTRSTVSTDSIYSDGLIQKEQYQLFEKSRRVIFLNNSKAGAIDYSRWIGVNPSRFKIIYNGVDFESFKNASSENAESFKSCLGIDKETALIGGIFRLSPEKRPFDFISVVKEVKKSISNVKCVIAGIGYPANENKVKEKIREEGLEDTIFLLGQRIDTDIIIKACNVVLLTSEREGAPNVLLEAQFLRVPVVATNVGGILETVESGKSGLLHSLGDIEGMADSIVRVLRDKAFAAKLGEEGHKFVTGRFNMEHMVNETLDTYYNNGER